MKNFFKKGISVAEIIIIVAVIALLAGIVLPKFSSLRENEVLTSTVNDVLSSIDQARQETLSALNSAQYGVHFQSNQIIIFKGASYSANDPNNQVINIASPASITNVTFGGVSGASGDVYFDQIHNIPSTTGTITVSTASYSKTVTLSATGVASSN